jgi:hypothetical protein
MPKVIGYQHWQSELSKSDNELSKSDNGLND